MDIPTIIIFDSLKGIQQYKQKDQVDVILANPPFVITIADGGNQLPCNVQMQGICNLFVILMLQLLKPKGRCAIVLPDGSITGDGVKSRIRKKLLTDTNLHTIIRLPSSTFFPATGSTNLLFFEKSNQRYLVLRT